MEAFVYGGCRLMQEVMAATRQAAACDVPVLLEGETGTGKGLLARWIHAQSGRRGGPLVEVDVPSLSGELMASLLFGHEKGAFTGAQECRRGFFERADGGTLFLDEIGELSPALQPKLLRVLDEALFYRVGGDRPIRADVRIIAATNRDLRAEVRAGGFRPDLYYRLDGIRIELPPLRHRREQIPVLVEHFLRQEGGGPNGVPSVSAAAMRLLQEYDWPGNVRELRNVVRRIGLMANREVTAADVRRLLRAWAELSELQSRCRTLAEKLAEVERREIEEALRRCGGNKSLTMRLLGISRATLKKKLRRYGLS